MFANRPLAFIPFISFILENMDKMFNIPDIRFGLPFDGISMIVLSFNSIWSVETIIFHFHHNYLNQPIHSAISNISFRS